MQNTALHIATGCTRAINTQHLHEETSILLIKQHMELHSSQLRQKAQHLEHTLLQFLLQPRNMKQIIFHNVTTQQRDTFPDTTTDTLKNKVKHIHTEIVQNHL